MGVVTKTSLRAVYDTQRSLSRNATQARRPTATPLGRATSLYVTLCNSQRCEIDEVDYESRTRHESFDKKKGERCCRQSAYTAAAIAQA